MVRIAICDDEAEAVSRHAEIVRSALQRCGVGFELKTYTRSDNLLYDITDDHIFYDLLLLDIEMPGFQGMELCGRVKPFLPNVKVIFITSHIEYAIDAYEAVGDDFEAGLRQYFRPLVARDGFSL